MLLCSYCYVAIVAFYQDIHTANTTTFGNLKEQGVFASCFRSDAQRYLKNCAFVTKVAYRM